MRLVRVPIASEPWTSTVVVVTLGSPPTAIVADDFSTAVPPAMRLAEIGVPSGA